MFKEDWQRIKKSMEEDIKHAKKTIEISEVLLIAVNAKIKTAKKDPNIVDVGIAKIKTKPTGVG